MPCCCVTEEQFWRCTSVILQIWAHLQEIAFILYHCRTFLCFLQVEVWDDRTAAALGWETSGWWVSQPQSTLEIQLQNKSSYYSSNYCFSVIFQSKLSNLSWFQLLTCENELFFFLSFMRVHLVSLGFWLLVGQKKQFEDTASIFLLMKCENNCSPRNSGAITSQFLTKQVSNL